MKYYRSVHMKVLVPDGRKFERCIVQAPEGSAYPLQSIPLLVSHFIYALKDQYPGTEYRAIKVQSNRYTVLPVPLGNA